MEIPERVRWVYSGSRTWRVWQERRAGVGGRLGSVLRTFQMPGEAQHQLFGRSLWPLENGGDGVKVEAEMLRAALLQQ